MDTFILFLQEISIPLALTGLILLLQAFTTPPEDIKFEDIDKQINNKNNTN